MTQTALIQTRIDPALKERIEKTFKRLGMSTSEAMRLFCNQVDIEQGLPFKPRIPNKRLRKAIDDVENKRGLIRAQDVNELRAQLGL